eukprot:TRINITY_DN4876_c0_g1_i1.p1 TRINITY_DN4876_c0_g1~~TRINITY_DN4876_c0_g1_i1.p1  ORF type:complete len:525 (-),score=179.91 TRINITY_DN4876_c0_g1_i1:298-1872(-)
MAVAPGVKLISAAGVCPSPVWRRELIYRLSILLITFLAYTSYHLSRKPISIVKNSAAFLDCGPVHNDSTRCKSWITQIDGKTEAEAKTFLGLLDTSYLFSYAFFMFGSGFVAERMDLRYFLSLGMIMSGVFTFLFGFAKNAGIHSLWYLLAIQIALGMFQATGWPGVVSVMANWFGKGKRGLIMGLWNSHTSLGNILGSLVAGAFVNHDWGLSFQVPGMIIAGVGFLLFLFMVPKPSDVGLAENSTTRVEETDAENENAPLMDNKSSEDSEEPPFGRVQVLNEERAIGFLGALKIPGVVEFSLCLFFSKLVSYTFLYWLPNYIHSTSGVDAEESAVLSTIFDLGGIVGGTIAGLVSDNTGNPASTCAVMLIMAIPTMFMYEGLVTRWCPITADHGRPIHNSCFTWNIILTLVTGTLVNGPYALITTAVSAELGQHPSLRGSGKALATVTAIIDGTGSIGAAIGPFLAGALSGHGNWDNVFYMLMAADVFALIFLTRLVKQEVGRYLDRRRTVSETDTDYQSINS